MLLLLLQLLKGAAAAGCPRVFVSFFFIHTIHSKWRVKQFLQGTDTCVQLHLIDPQHD